MSELAKVNEPSVSESALRLPEHVRHLIRDDTSPVTGELVWNPPAAVPECTAQELPMLMARYERALRPAQRDEIILALSKLLAVLRVEDDDGWKLRFETYAEDLADVPPDILHEALRHWRRTEKFWPTIAELLALTTPPLNERRRVLDRLNRLHAIANGEPMQAVTRERAPHRFRGNVERMFEERLKQAPGDPNS